MTVPKNDIPITRARRTEFTTRAEGEEMIIEGYFVVFEQPYYVDDYCEEIIARGAFDGADMSDVRALIDHLPHLVIGRSTVNTLSFSIDDTGLFATIKINARDADAVSLYARTQRGDVDQASFGFEEEEVTYTDLPDGRIRRTINKISKLWEVSVCTFPAYEQTFVSARSKVSANVKDQRLRAQKEKLKRRFKHHA